MNNNHLILITNDLFDIATRLLSVKSSYVTYYNNIKKRYEVYDGDSFAFAVPYTELDSRTIDYARKTAVQHADELFAEIDRHNRDVTRRAVESSVAQTMQKINNKEVL